MWSHIRTRALLAAVIAGVCASAGCFNPYLNPFQPYPPYPPYGYPPPDKSAPPPVDNRTADSLVRAQYQPPTPPASVGLPTPLPVPVPPTQPQAVPPPRAMGGNPHERATPSVTGKDWALGPNELPIDRAAELQRRLEELVEENRKLQARMVTLEANGLSREQSLNEAIREVEKATELVMKSRADVQALRTELIALRERVKKAEDNELNTLKTVIEALKQLLDDK